MSGKTIREGLILGFIGYVTVALVYFIFDFLAARGFLYTVDLLGKAMFRGLTDSAVTTLPIKLDWLAIFAYNAFHLIISFVIGLIIIGFVDYTEIRPARAQFVLFSLLVGFVVTVVIVSFFTSSFGSLLPWWSIIIANLLSVIAASFYLLKKHPGIGPHLIYLLAKITTFPFKNKPTP